MSRGERNIERTGSASINNTGDGVTIQQIRLSESVRPLNRTYLYQFCSRFADLEESPTTYNTEFASDILEKIQHNEIPGWRETFTSVDHFYDDVDEILIGIQRRERVLASIKGMYDELKRSAEWTNKDELCDIVKNNLYARVESDWSSVDLIREDAEQALTALMYYAFVKCKLLDPVPTSDVG